MRERPRRVTPVHLRRAICRAKIEHRQPTSFGDLPRPIRRGQNDFPLELSTHMRIIPLGPNVVVRRLQAEEKTTGGIVLPDNARKKPREGRVLSVGDGQILPDGQRAKPQVNEGDRVLFNDFAGSEVQVNGEELLILNEEEILAVFS
jgi:chaperonin GroES